MYKLDRNVMFFSCGFKILVNINTALNSYAPWTKSFFFGMVEKQPSPFLMKLACTIAEPRSALSKKQEWQYLCIGAYNLSTHARNTRRLSRK